MPTGSTVKPTVTPDHHKRYADIMNTAVKTAAPTAPPPVQTDAQKSSVISSLLASVPKAKGIGNKIFVFTGKKKIILDGKEQEVEKIKTVSPIMERPQAIQVISSSAPITTTPEKEEQESPIIIKTMAEKQEVPIPPPPPPEIKNTPEKKAPEAPKTIGPSPKPAAAPKKAIKTTSGKKSPGILYTIIGVALVLFLSAWTVFWAVFFGLLKV